MKRNTKAAAAIETTERQLTALEYAIERGVSLDYVYKQLRQGKISGAHRRDGQWVIPVATLNASAPPARKFY